MMELEWSQRALDDLNRFARFLNTPHPSLARIVAEAIITKARVLSQHPELGRPLAGSSKYRQLELIILNATYVFRYRYDGKRLVMMRVFHSRESR